MKTKILNLLLILTLISFFSCYDNDGDTYNHTYKHPTDETINVGTTYLYRLEKESDTWSVSSLDEELVFAKINKNELDNELEIKPLKTGNTSIIVSDSTNTIVFTCKLEIIKGQRSYTITSLSSNIEVSNPDYKKPIEDEIMSLQPFPVGTKYILVYPELTQGELTILPGDNPDKKISGSFTDNHTITHITLSTYPLFLNSSTDNNDGITFFYDNKEENYKMGVKRRDSISSSIDYYLIKDRTQYFNTKYPEAGVQKAHGYQIMDYHWD